MAKKDKKAKEDQKAQEVEPEAVTIAEAADAATASAAGMAMPLIIGVGVVFVAIIIFALPTFIVAAAGMVPTIVVALIPAKGRRPSIAPVALMNLAGIVSVLGPVWSGDNTVAGAIMTLQSPITWLIVLVAVGLGVALRSIFPNIATSFIARASENKGRRLKADQKDLVAEWGAGVRGPVNAGAKKGTAAAKAKPALAKSASGAAAARNRAPKTIARV